MMWIEGMVRRDEREAAQDGLAIPRGCVRRRQKMRDQTGSDRGGHVMSQREMPIDEEVEFAHPQFASGAGQFRGERSARAPR